jgi:hypothetical protein
MKGASTNELLRVPLGTYRGRVVDEKFCVLHSPPDYGHGSEARTRTKIGTVFKVLDTAYYKINKGDQAL